jgi:hypothetical protein
MTESPLIVNLAILNVVHAKPHPQIVQHVMEIEVLA